MRIIAGEHRGRKLLPPPDDSTRPITDRAKQSVFDVLSPYIEGAVVYDIFAGTGSMGLECLSRGAARAVFFEAGRGALTNLRANITTLRVTDASHVMAGDLYKLLPALPLPEPRVGLCFLDPPYRYLNQQPESLMRLAEELVERHLAADGLVIFRHDSADKLTLPRLEVADVREYGGMIVELLRPTASPSAS
jgi:16S rRNA (guanine(966)-N(2))-methyltransferase RsmD